MTSRLSNDLYGSYFPVNWRNREEFWWCSLDSLTALIAAVNGCVTVLHEMAGIKDEHSELWPNSNLSPPSPHKTPAGSLSGHSRSH